MHARIPGICSIFLPVADIQSLTVLDCLSVRPSICLSVCLFAYLYVRLSVYSPAVCLSICNIKTHVVVFLNDLYRLWSEIWFFFSWTFKSCYNWVCYQTEFYFSSLILLIACLRVFIDLQGVYNNLVVIEPERLSFYHSVHRHTFMRIIHSPYLNFIVDWSF